jgi:hypothetical protein
VGGGCQGLVVVVIIIIFVVVDYDGKQDYSLVFT